jgi:alkylhydroperoxidase/carboxymuconolactone decarboxylase family protein YurZ
MQLPDETDRAFRSFYDAAHQTGVLDRQTKILIHLAVAMALGCDP